MGVLGKGKSGYVKVNEETDFSLFLDFGWVRNLISFCKRGTIAFQSEKSIKAYHCSPFNLRRHPSSLPPPAFLLFSSFWSFFFAPSLLVRFRLLFFSFLHLRCIFFLSCTPHPCPPHIRFSFFIAFYLFFSLSTAFCFIHPFIPYSLLRLFLLSSYSF